jgi:hypothetical protein
VVVGVDAEISRDSGGLDDDQRVMAESRVRTAFSGSLWSGCWARTKVLWATATFRSRWCHQFSAE